MMKQVSSTKRQHKRYDMTCEVCGKTFEAFRKDALMCALACRRIKHNRKKYGSPVPQLVADSANKNGEKAYPGGHKSIGYNDWITSCVAKHPTNIDLLVCFCTKCKDERIVVRAKLESWLDFNCGNCDK